VGHPERLGHQAGDGAPSRERETEKAFEHGRNQGSGAFWDQGGGKKSSVASSRSGNPGESTVWKKAGQTRMSYHKSPQKRIAGIFLFLLSVGCGTPVATPVPPTPTAMPPTATPTPIPPTPTPTPVFTLATSAEEVVGTWQAASW